LNLPPLVNYSSENEYRDHFERVYCHAVLETFDGVKVRFRKSDFDHGFFESSNKAGSKDAFSRRRAERIDWIAAVLRDPTCELYQGWDNVKKRSDARRRVSVANEDYVVVIRFTGKKRSEFVTAFVADPSMGPGKPSTVDRIRNGPKWSPQ